MHREPSKSIHAYATCWRVPVLIHVNGKDRRREPIINATTVEEAEQRARDLYGDDFVSFAALPYHTHDSERVGE